MASNLWRVAAVAVTLPSPHLDHIVVQMGQCQLTFSIIRNKKTVTSGVVSFADITLLLFTSTRLPTMTLNRHYIEFLAVACTHNATSSVTNSDQVPHILVTLSQPVALIIKCLVLCSCCHILSTWIAPSAQMHEHQREPSSRQGTMLEKRGWRSIFETGFYMKTHKLESVTCCRKMKKCGFCDFSVT